MKPVSVLALAASTNGALISMNAATSTRQNLSPFANKALGFVSAHPIVQRNEYCAFFSSGKANLAQTQDLVVQFSVFSNLFLLAQLNKVINAPTKDDMREGKEILTNELGVVFKPKSQKTSEVDGKAVDPAVVSCTGSVVGGVYNHRAAHFEWLCDVGSSVGLDFADIGKRRHGSPATLHFCDKLYEIYGSENPSISLGASFAIEHWANGGFWDDLVDGFTKMNARSDIPKTPLGFWKFHQALEAQHAEHTMDELEEALESPAFTVDEVAFEAAANDMLDACAVFWGGLEAERKALA